MQTIQILWMNKSFTPEGTGVKTHTHPYYHFFLMTKGALGIKVGEQTFEVREGSSLLVPKDAPHSYLNYEKTTAECVEIKFTLQDPGLETRLSEEKGAVLTDDPAVTLLGVKTAEEYSSLGALGDEAARAYLNAILQIMTRRYRVTSGKEGLIDVAGFSELTKDVVAYLEAHYGEPFSLDKLALALSYNKAYLCTAFKKDMKVTIAECLNLIRVRHAAQMISYSELPIGEVAQACGFGTASHFNHVFQHTVGIKPTAVRKAYPNHLLLGPSGRREEKETYPERMLYNVLAGKMIVSGKTGRS